MLDKKWKTLLCNSGNSCWCRCIATEDYDEENEHSEGMENIVAPDGCLSKEVAEHIVSLHNEQIVRDRIHMMVEEVFDEPRQDLNQGV